MRFFMHYLLPAIIFMAVCVGHFCVLIFKPKIVDEIMVNFGIDGFQVGRSRPLSRVGFICWASLWGIAGMAILLNGFGVISGESVPKMFLVGILVAVGGVVYSLFSSVGSNQGKPGQTESSQVKPSKTKKGSRKGP